MGCICKSAIGKQKKSLKTHLFLGFLILSLLMILLFGSLMAIMLYYQGISDAKAFLKNKNEATINYIQGYFTPLRKTIEFLAQKPFIIDATVGEEAQANNVQTLTMFATFKNIFPNASYIYSGYEDGTLLIENYTPPPGYDTQNRPWYQAALASYPNISKGIPYREAVSNEWMVSLSKGLADEKGNVKGVVSIDSTLNEVTKNWLTTDPDFTSSYSFVENSEGVTIIHHREELIGKVFHDAVETDGDLSESQGYLNYTFENKDKIAFYSNLDSLGWTVITVVEKSEIIHGIIIKIFISLVIVALVSLLIGRLVSRTLSDKIICPLLSLESRLKAIVSGNDVTKHSDSFSEFSEIDKITEGIEDLTHQSLFQKNQELEQKNKLMQTLSETDHLTGLFNRRKFNEELEKEYQRAKRYDSIFSVIMLDIDWFKKVNDTYGHDAGDRVLKELSFILNSTIRSVDKVARWGGEEFLILCPQTGLDGATVIAKKIRETVEHNPFSVLGKITVSVGVREYSPDLSLDELLIEVDHKLYQAKSNGRNRVET